MKSIVYLPKFIIIVFLFLISSCATTSKYFNDAYKAQNDGRLEEAEALYKLAIKLDSNDVYSYNNLGSVLIELKRFDEAKDYLEKAIRIDPHYANALFNLVLISKQEVIVPPITEDTIPPTIKITNPTNVTESGISITVDGNTINISGVISDNQALALAKLIVNDGKDVSLNIKNPQQVQFDQKISLQQGKNKIIIMASDAAGNKSEFLIFVNCVERDTTPPVIVLLSPANVFRDIEVEGRITKIESNQVQPDSNTVSIEGLVNDKSDIDFVTINKNQVYLIRPTEEDKSKFPENTNTYRFDKTLFLKRMNNNLTIRAVDKKGNAKDTSMTVEIGQPIPPPSPPSPPPLVYTNRWAILIGVNNYQNYRSLNYAAKDAKDMAKLLTGSLGFRKENIIVLLDTISLDQTAENIIAGTEDSVAGTVKRATKQNILEAMAAMADNKRIKLESQVLIFFSGHGATKTVSGRESGFIITEDAAMDENIGNLRTSSLPMSEVRDRALDIPAKHVLFLVDACYSGLATSIMRDASQDTSSSIEIIKDIPVKEIITAGSVNDRAIESPDFSNGVFTKKVKDGISMRWADINRDGYITSNELFSYLRNTVPKAAKQVGGSQYPIHAVFIGDGEFIFELQK